MMFVMLVSVKGIVPYEEWVGSVTAFLFKFCNKLE
jgi:hypothetical protein